MNKGLPAVSVIVPTYNRGHLIGETLASLRRQKFADFEVVIIDDESTDETEEVCNVYSETDPRFIFVRNNVGNRGPGYCRNRGIRIARGKYLVFLDSDDLLLEDALADRFHDMERAPDLDFTVYLGRFFGGSSNNEKMLWNCPTSRDPLIRFLTDDVPWPTSGPMWRRSSIRRIGGWSQSIRMGDDQELHTRAILSGLCYEYHPRVDHLIRKHQSQLGRGEAIVDSIRSQSRRIEAYCLHPARAVLDPRYDQAAAGSLLKYSIILREILLDCDLPLAIWEVSTRYSLVNPIVDRICRRIIESPKSLLGECLRDLLATFSSSEFMHIDGAQIGSVPLEVLGELQYDDRYHIRKSYLEGSLRSKGLVSFIKPRVARFARRIRSRF